MSESEGEGEVIETPPESKLPVPPSQDQIDNSFKAVRAQSKFQVARADWVVQCEHHLETLNEALLLCKQEDAVAQLPAISERITWAIEHAQELRDEVAAVPPPALPPPPETPPAAWTENQVNVAKRLEHALAMMAEMQINTLLQCDQIGTTLQVAKQWCSEEDAAEHLQEVTNGVYGAIEQTARLRSTLGSTQS